MAASSSSARLASRSPTGRPRRAELRGAFVPAEVVAVLEGDLESGMGSQDFRTKTFLDQVAGFHGWPSIEKSSVDYTCLKAGMILHAD
ncbi:hypothetical protein D3C78_1354180 [compost metagenome]